MSTRAGRAVLKSRRDKGRAQAVGLIWRVRDRSDRSRRLSARRSTGASRSPVVHVHSPIPPLTPPRVAFALGRALGPAVVRNRLRRRLRALLSVAPPPPGLYLVGARPDAVARSFVELQF